jgi:hypothetical protein
LLLITLVAALSAQVKPVDFQREIRPILSKTCFQCHGPDPSTRMMNLRLDTKEGVFEHRKTGTPVVPGKPAESLVYQRISHAEKARRMPPEYSHKTLTPEQIETIKRWIAEGAEWRQHWSLIAPVRPKPPAVTNRAWVKNPIDRFILARLEQNGLAPAPPAGRRTLIRRVSLDLTGLPPTPEEVEAFVKDQSPDAYEKLVDRLMASERWGEHRGRYWLDAARYGDTHGLHIDNYREIWPYRDWVIQALNRNMPFDQFTIEQIAGDLLENPSMDQLIATGFHRSNVTTNEGGVIPEEVAAMYAKDRADTTGTVWLGLTVGCATCHDHKFDPISTKDFYSLTAFFRNTLQKPLDGNIADTPPTMVVPREEDLPRWRQIGEEEVALKARIEKVRGSSRPEFEKWLEEKDRPEISGPLAPADELLAVTATSDGPAITLKNQRVYMTLPQGVSIGPGHTEGRQALHFKDKAFIELPSQDHFEADSPFAIAAWVYLPKGEDNFVVASQTDPRSKYRGWALELNARIPMLRISGQSNKSVTVRSGIADRFEPGTWNHVAFSYDGSRETAGLALFVNGKPVFTEGRGYKKEIEGEFRNYAPLRIGSDGKRKHFDGGAIADLRIFTRALREEDARLASLWPVLDQARGKPAGELAEAEREALHLYFLNREYTDYQDVTDEFQELQRERHEIASRGAVTHIQQEQEDQKPFAHILYRGMYDQPREKVEPAVPGALPPMPESYPKNRLGLAKWLVDANNPLTARVTVNRFWQEVFGTGLVKTSEDFGSQGERPSHPELLDWLAVEFRESGWDLKKFFKLMLTSATYRQSAAVTPAKIEKDPENRLLSRGPRFRMDAEMVRDYALAASGLLNPKIGGPSVKPYQPEGVWETVAMKESDTRFYKRDAGKKLYRRSMYTFWKRSAPPPSMDIFNAPTRETCTVRRERTNTPLQALVTMNDTQFMEAARQLAETAILKGGNGADQSFEFMAERLLARPFNLKEREIVKAAYRDYLKHYDSNPADAKKLIAAGESEPDGSIGAVELAAMTMVANQVMNLDEVLNK